jgi:hypothetical protein
MIDPENPALVLGHLPAEVLEELFEYTLRYKTGHMVSASGRPPAEDQVKSARKWLDEIHRKPTEAIQKSTAD